jgi:hypothetical protein
MGGVKGQGAFSKGSDDATALYKMFINKELSLTAEPADIIDLFPEQKEKTSSQIRSSFNRIRDNAKETLSLLTQVDDGNYFFC